MIEGHCPQLLQNLLEVRGLGLLDIRTIFGETSVRRKMRLKLIVHLVRATAQDKFERLPLQDITQDMLGLPVRKVMLQVAAGRNLAVLVEAAVRNTILKLRGIDTLGEFMERQAMAILQRSKSAGPYPSLMHARNLAAGEAAGPAVAAQFMPQSQHVKSRPHYRHLRLWQVGGPAYARRRRFYLRGQPAAALSDRVRRSRPR